MKERVSFRKKILEEGFEKRSDCRGEFSEISGVIAFQIYALFNK